MLEPPCFFLALRCAASSLLLAVLPAAASAQLIPIRTVPVSQAHQFEIFPSHTRGMGGAAIATRDSLLDPFTNPATAVRIGAPRVFASPVAYSVSREAGGGWALPLGALAKAGPWYGGLSLALQSVEPGKRAGIPLPLIADCAGCEGEGFELNADPTARGNRYGFALLGRELSATGISVGASILWARLNAVDGVDLLYARSARVDQSGQAVDVRLGMLAEWDGDRALEAVVLHERVGLTHDVFSLEPFWDPGTRRETHRLHRERSLDRATTWGLHTAYQAPLGAEDWRIGWLATVNRSRHPAIPDYDVLAGAGDRGRSTALNLGVGIGRVQGPARVDGRDVRTEWAADLVYEPIWRYTRSDAGSPTETRSGEAIPAGRALMENRFRFSNVLVRLGAGKELELDGHDSALALQLGLLVRSVRYTLRQRDHVEESAGRQPARWVETAPAWGVGFRRAAWELRYDGRITYGTARPIVAPFPRGFCTGIGVCAARHDAALTLPAYPGTSLALQRVNLLQHQVSLSIPLGRATRPGGAR